MILLSGQASIEWDRLLREAMGEGSPEFRQWLARYQTDTRYRLYGLRKQALVIGLLGVHCSKRRSVEISHIAVDRRYRRQHLGAEMIGLLTLMCRRHRLIAYTDDDAVGFYRKMGFDVECLGEVYPGRVRYCCTRNPYPMDTSRNEE